MSDTAEEFERTAREYEELKQKLRDPVVLAELMHRLSEERSSSNLVLKEINAKLDRLLSLEGRIDRIEEKLGSRNASSSGVSEVDGGILKFIGKKGRACAEEVQSRFSYKGRNGASSRLNGLCKLGILRKTQIGRKVYFEKA